MACWKSELCTLSTMRDDQRKRYNHILRSIANESVSQKQLALQLGRDQRTIRNDIDMLSNRFPGRIIKERNEYKEVCYRWDGLPPYILSEQHKLKYIDHYELMALVAARGLLSDPNTETYDGPLDGAIHRLLSELGVDEEVHRIDPRAIQIDRFAALSENPDHLSVCIKSVLEGRSLLGLYRNIHGEEHEVHLLPLRLLVIDSEFHCLAWDAETKNIKDYRVARFNQLKSTRQRPLNAPAHIDVSVIDRHRQNAFRTHAHPEQRYRVSLALDPNLHPHVKDRHWGGEQEWEDDPDDLPENWARLTFTTSGLPACCHWVLSLGSGVCAEGPEELCKWLHNQALGIIEHYGASHMEEASAHKQADGFTK